MTVHEDRQRIAREVAAYLRRGGKIKKIARGVSGDVWPMHRSQAELLKKSKRGAAATNPVRGKKQ